MAWCKTLLTQHAQVRWQWRCNSLALSHSHECYITSKQFGMEKGLMKHLTLWGRETHICIGEHVNIDSNNGLSPSWCQAIIWTSGGILLIGPLLNLNRNSYIFIQENAFENVVWKMAAILSRPGCVNQHIIDGDQGSFWVWAWPMKKGVA